MAAALASFGGAIEQVITMDQNLGRNASIGSSTPGDGGILVKRFYDIDQMLFRTE